MIANLLVIIGFILIVNIIKAVLVYFDEKQWEQWRKDHPIVHTTKTPITNTINNEVDIPYYQQIDKAAYLKSVQWNILRNRILTRDNYTCCKCGITNVRLEVHHIHYANLGNEPLEDLVTLCRNCHQSIHNKYGYDHYGYFPIKEQKCNTLTSPTMKYMS